MFNTMSASAFKIFIVLFCCHLSALAQHCDHFLTVSQFETILENVKKSQYPNLLNEKIILKTFKSDSYFLQVKPTTNSLLKNKNSRTYALYLNLNLLNCPPDQEALEAILAHELEHIVDYSRKTNLQLINQALKFTTNISYRSQYERQTDESAMKKGFSNGLKKYRLWQYQKLSAKDLKMKKIIYYTPEEIDDWQKKQNESSDQ